MYSMEYDSKKYYNLGQIIGFYIVLLDDKISIKKTFQENEMLAIETEKEFRNSFFTLYMDIQDLMESNADIELQFKAGFSEGVRKGLSLKSIDKDNNQMSLINDDKFSKYIGAIKTFLAHKSKFVQTDLEKSDLVNLKSKLFVCNFNLVVKVSNVRNVDYMKTLAEELCKRIVGSFEIRSNIDSLCSSFPRIDSYYFNYLGAFNIPPEIIGNPCAANSDVVVTEECTKPKNKNKNKNKPLVKESDIIKNNTNIKPLSKNIDLAKLMKSASMPYEDEEDDTDDEYSDDESSVEDVFTGEVNIDTDDIYEKERNDKVDKNKGYF